MVTFPTRVAARAADIQPVRVLLSVLAAPFYLLGLFVGVLIVAFAWCWAAVAVGIGDVKARGRAR